MVQRSFNLADIDIWERFLSGDDKAFISIYNRYVNGLYSYGLKIFGDEDLVKDCIQEVFIHLIENRRKLLISPNIHLYLFKSLRNKLLDELRSSARKQEILAEKGIVDDEHFSSAEKLIIQDETQQQVRQRLTKVLNELSDKQREIIYLKYTECLSYDEISDMLGIDKASARTLLYRTLKSLKETINKKGIFLFRLFRAIYR